MINIRPALNSDGQTIGKMAYDAGFLLGGLDWDHIEPDWLVAEHKSAIVGAIQVLPGKPVGRLELLILDPQQPRRVKLMAMKHLTLAGCMIVRNYGGQVAMGLVRPQSASYRKIIEKRGAKNMGTVDMYAWEV